MSEERFNALRDCFWASRYQGKELNEAVCKLRELLVQPTTNNGINQDEHGIDGHIVAYLKRTGHKLYHPDESFLMPLKLSDDDLSKCYHKGQITPTLLMIAFMAFKKVFAKTH